MNLIPLNGEEVKAFRRSQRWTQREMANLLGIHVLTLIRWERPENHPEKGQRGPPLYLRLVFAAIDQGLDPWYNGAIQTSAKTSAKWDNLSQ